MKHIKLFEEFIDTFDDEGWEEIDNEIKPKYKPKKKKKTWMDLTSNDFPDFDDNDNIIRHK